MGYNKKRGRGRGRIIIAAAALAVAALVGVFGALNGWFAGDNDESAPPPAEETGADNAEPSPLQGDPIVMTVGGFDVSAAVFDYFYYRGASQAAQGGLLDMSLPLGEQAHSDTQSWAEVLYEQTVDAVELYVALYLQARERGYTLEEQEQAEFADEMDYWESGAESEGVTVQDMLRSVFGPRITPEIYRDIYEQMTLATRFAMNRQREFEFSDEALEEAFQASPERFEVIEFRYFAIPGEHPDWDEDTPEDEIEAFHTAQKAKAEDFLERVTTSEAFHPLVLEAIAAAPELFDNAGPDPADDSASLVVMPVSELMNFPGEQFEHITDPAREPLDKAMFENDHGDFGIFLFVSRHRDESPSVDVRHILIGFDEEAEEPNTDEARQRAEELLQEWKDGDANEDSFAALASEHTDDTASIPDGGLYQNITSATNFVQPFLDWSIDGAREPGDTGIVETEFGFHIMYFVRGEPAWTVEAREVLGREMFEAFCDELTGNVETEIHEDGMAYAMGDLIPIEPPDTEE